MTQDQISRLRAMIKRKPALIWYTKAHNTLNEEAVAEAVYNYGSWDDVIELHKTLGLSTAKTLFQTLAQKPRPNLRPAVRNYFSLYYAKHPS